MSLTNTPNLLSLSRVPALFVVAGLLWIPWPGAASAAFIVFVLAALTDWLDGYWARKTNQITDDGKIMDALTDKVLMVGIFTTLIVAEVYPDWGLIFLLIILTRELMVTGMRAMAAARGVVLAAERGGKIKTATQMTCAVITLAGMALKQDFAQLQLGNGLIWAGLALFVVAGVLTAQSGYTYLRKYAQAMA